MTLIYTGIPAWMHVLKEIYRHSEKTIKQIELYDILREQKTVITYSFISKILTGLQEQGYINKKIQGRTIIITLTQKGLRTSEYIQGVCKYAEIK